MWGICYMVWYKVSLEFFVWGMNANRFKATGYLPTFTLGMPLRLALSFGTQLGIFRSEIRNSIVYGIVQIQYGRID